MKLILSFLLVSLISVVSAQTNIAFRKAVENKLYEMEQPITVFVHGNHSEILKYAESNGMIATPTVRSYVKINCTWGQLVEFSEKASFKRIDFSFSKGHLLNDTARKLNNVEPIHNGAPTLLDTFFGAGVIMGMIDGGIDYGHPDFMWPSDSSTRVLRYWKQHEPFDAQLTPAQYGYGIVYDSAMINSGAASLGGEQGIDHGCTVTGSASGNAFANGRHKGMAPETDIIMVSSDFSIPNWKASVADAVEYIVETANALGKPVVVNASLGDYLGSHDGLDPTALYIDSLLAANPGRLMVCAAGNSGAIGSYHLKHNVSNDTAFTWFEHNSSTVAGYPGVYLEIWGDTADMNSLEFAIATDKVSPTYERRGISNFVDLTSSLSTSVYDTIAVNGNNLATIEWFMELRDGQYRLEVALDSPDSSQYNFALITAGTGEVDMWSASWLGMNDMPTNIPDSATFPEIVNYRLPDTLSTIVDSWTCSPNVVTTGNYYSRLTYLAYDSTWQTVPGTQYELSVSSSKGPTRTGLMKPDIAATGDMSLSAGSLSLLAYNQANDPAKLDVGGMHVRNGGTSMASPMVAGIGALLLEKCPTITAAEFVNAVQSTGTSDTYTGLLPNYGFGYGKVDGLAILEHTNFEPAISGDDFYCLGSYTTLSASGFSSYQWNLGQTTPSLIVFSDTDVWVATWNSYGCKGVSDTVSVFEAPNPPQPNLSQIGNSLISDPAWDYQWYLNGSAITGETGQQLIVGQSGWYQVEVFNQYGCSSISDSVYLSMVGVEEEGLNVTMHPNPFVDDFIIELSEICRVSIYAPDGRLIRSEELPSGKSRIRELDAVGVYVLVIDSDEGRHATRVIKTIGK